MTIAPPDRAGAASARSGPVRPGRAMAAAGGAAAVVAGALYVRAVDPHGGSAPLPMCPTKLVTGLDCPACGGLRAAHDLLHGDLFAALGHNLFLPIAFLILAVPAGAALIAWLRGRSRPLPRTLAIAVLIAAVVFTVVRNLPGSPLSAG